MTPKPLAEGSPLFWQGSSKIRELILLFVLLLPVFFINVKESHSWSGDFALYIHQAKNLAEGKPQVETGYIFNDQCFLPSPKHYFRGLPDFIRSNLLFLWQQHIGIFIFCFICLISAGICFILFLSNLFFPDSSWGGSALIIIYNP